MQVIPQLLRAARAVANLGVKWGGDVSAALAGLFGDQACAVSHGGEARRRGFGFDAVLGGLLVGAAIPSLAFAGPPSVKIGRAPLLSPAQADAYYAGSTTWTPSSDPGMLTDANKISAGVFLATDDDYAYFPDRAFEFVRNTVATTWTYGLTKGAKGAVIDRSGGAFDQAHLLVTILRNEGYAASYKLGTIQLTGPQFASWSGVTSATAACQLLSSGGIPAVINGSTIADCGYGAATVTQIQLGHVWVTVPIDGTEYVFDPAFKPYDFKSGRNVASDAGLLSGQALAVATTGMQSGADAATQVAYIRQANADGLKAQLDAYALGIQNSIQSNIAAGSAEDLVGGGTIRPVGPVAGVWRQTALPYPSIVSRTITTSDPWDPELGNLPDRYRTKLRVQLHAENPNGEALNTVLYADDFYGWRLQFEPTFSPQSSGSGMGIMGYLKAKHDRWGDEILGQTTASLSTAASGRIVLTLDMPYAAATDGVAGDYMDAVFDRRLVFALPHAIVLGWGQTDPALIDRIGTAKDMVLPMSRPPACDLCNTEYHGSKGDARRQLLAATWLAQSSRAGELHAAIAQSVYTHHYSIGVVAADTRITSTVHDPNFPSTTTTHSLPDSFDRMDIESGLSLTSKTANSIDRRAAIHAIAATLEVLEGSVSAQVSDLPDASSAAMRFDWGNKPPANEDNPLEPSAASGPRRFYAFDATNVAHVGSLAKVEGQLTNSAFSTHGPDEPIIGSAEFNARRNQLKFAVEAYANAGFSIVASEEAFLGPGQRAGSFNRQATNNIFTHFYSRQRGGALIAKRYDVSGDPVEIAHVSVAADFGAIKGGEGELKSTTRPSTTHRQRRTFSRRGLSIARRSLASIFCPESSTTLALHLSRLVPESSRTACPRNSSGEAASSRMKRLDQFRIRSPNRHGRLTGTMP